MYEDPIRTGPRVHAEPILARSSRTAEDARQEPSARPLEPPQRRGHQGGVEIGSTERACRLDRLHRRGRRVDDRLHLIEEPRAVGVQRPLLLLTRSPVCGLLEGVPLAFKARQPRAPVVSPAGLSRSLRLAASRCSSTRCSSSRCWASRWRMARIPVRTALPVQTTILRNSTCAPRHQQPPCSA